MKATNPLKSTPQSLVNQRRGLVDEFLANGGTITLNGQPASWATAYPTPASLMILGRIVAKHLNFLGQLLNMFFRTQTAVLKRSNLH